jgi:hypothetical protein
MSGSIQKKTSTKITFKGWLIQLLKLGGIRKFDALSIKKKINPKYQRMHRNNRKNDNWSNAMLNDG